MSAIRVGAISDIECSRKCSTGACKQESTMPDEIAKCNRGLGCESLGECFEAHHEQAALKRAMDLLDAKLGDSDPNIEGMTQDEVDTTYPVLSAMQILSGLYCATAPARMSDAARDVLAERTRQVSDEGWTAAHDDAHACGEIAAFAAVYAMPEGARDWPTEETGYGATLSEAMTPHGWQPKFGDRRRDLVKAGALIVAEIERLDRAGGEA